MGPAAGGGPAGAVLGGVLPAGGRSADGPGVHGGVHAGVGGAVSALSSAFLPGGQRTVRQNLPAGQALPRTHRRGADMVPHRAVSAFRPGV